MIRVLHIVTKMNLGGLENMIMNYYRNIDRNKIQFDFLVQGGERGEFDDEIIELGGKIFNVNRINFFKPYLYEKEVYAFLKEHPEYEIVHSHINAFSKLSLSAAKKANVPNRLAHSHISKLDFNLKNLYKNFIKIGINKYATEKLACSQIAGEWLYGKNSDFLIFNNAIDIDRFKYNEEKRNRIRKELGISEQEIVVGHVGRFCEQKNHKFLIDIFKEYQKNETNSKLLLVGDGHLRNDIEKQIADLNIEDKVILIGNKKNVEDYYNTMDLFLFPSLFEGLPLTVIEAQINGLTCVSSKDVVTNEVDVTNHVKFISLKEDAKKWSELINELELARYCEIDKIKEAGYDVKFEANKLADLYKNLFKNKLETNKEKK